MSTNQNKSGKFSIILRFFHWSGVLIMVGVYASVWMRHLYEKGTSERTLVMSLHFALGILLLAWLVFRLLAYFPGVKPPIVPAQPEWQAGALRLMHGLLWAIMLVLPLSGWVMVNAGGRAVKISFLAMELPVLVSKNDTLAKMLKEGHEVMAVVLLILVAGHTLIGLWHHFFKKDNALKRML
ncbi:MAG: cytochrome b [Cystobacterineae bacterium]|nr:cytochrome b [Cystobacterineae bacterium]